MKFYLSTMRLLAFALTALALLAPASAQVVTQLPQFVSPNTVVDLGSGPLELRLTQGSAFLFTAQGSGTGGNGAVSGTGITLTATPTTPPCVGCTISGAGITSGTTVAAFNGTTGITLSAAMSVANGTALAWGATCPASPTGAAAAIMASVGGDVPMYTQAHVCVGAAGGPGASILPFPIGAH